jgi:CHASE3 domain sensor protein
VILQRHLENAAIRTKITMGFIFMLIILGIVGGMAYVSLAQIATAEGIVTQRSDINNLANDIGLKFTNVRRFAREYAHSGEAETAVQAENALKESQVAIDRALSAIHNPARLAKAREIASLQKA